MRQCKGGMHMWELPVVLLHTVTPLTPIRQPPCPLQVPTLAAALPSHPTHLRGQGLGAAAVPAGGPGEASRRWNSNRRACGNEPCVRVLQLPCTWGSARQQPSRSSISVVKSMHVCMWGQRQALVSLTLEPLAHTRVPACRALNPAYHHVRQQTKQLVAHHG